MITTTCRITNPKINNQTFVGSLSTHEGSNDTVFDTDVEIMVSKHKMDDWIRRQVVVMAYLVMMPCG